MDPRSLGAEKRWAAFVERVRTETDLSFDEQWRTFREIYDGRDGGAAPPPVWQPDDERSRSSNLRDALNRLRLDSYEDLHAWSVRDRPAFWRFVIDRLELRFDRPPERIVGRPEDALHPDWLPGARMNCVDSCLAAAAERPAIVWASEKSPTPRTISYEELARQVNRVANGLSHHGFRPGARIALYMPMNVECVAAYLGIIRAGCQVVSIADSFPPREIARRLEIADADGIVTVRRFVRAGRSIDPYRNVVAASAPRAIVVTSETDDAAELREGDIVWEQFLSDRTEFDSWIGPADHTTTVLFSSGTTGDPKAIPWTHLTAIKAAMDGHFHQDIRPTDVVAWPTNIGWMMGPWLIFAGLINRATIALYEGAPGGDGFLRFVTDAGVSVLGVVPSLVRAWRAAGVDSRPLCGVELFSSTGEPSAVRDYLWLMSRTGYRAPVIEYCGGTEIGGGYITGSVLHPASPASFTTPALGLDLVLIDDDGSPVGRTGCGEVFLVPPSIGLSERLLNRDHDETYYADCPTAPGGGVLRRHGDRLTRLPGGYYRSQGRADDTMNLGGIKIGSLEIEAVLEQHPAVSAAAAVGVQTGGEGIERLVVFVVLGEEIDRSTLHDALSRAVAGQLNPLFRLHDVVVVDTLPRTASNKLLRRVLRARYTEAETG